jgi:hypothetical protein
MFIHRRLLAPEGEEPTGNTPQPTQPTTPEQNDQAQGDDFPGKKHMAEEIVRLRRERDEIVAKQKEAADEAERKRLEEQGKWQEIAAKEKAEREKLEAFHKSEKREWELRAKLVGLPDLMIDGAIAKCPIDADVSEYAAKIMKGNEALLFGEPARKIAQGVGGAGSGGNGSLRERAKRNDPEAQREIFNRVLEGKDY